MKYRYQLIWVIIISLCAGIQAQSSARAYYLATKEHMDRLKQDLRSNRLQIGVTTLEEIRSMYGDARSVVDDERSVVYNYGDLVVNFEKKRVLRSWTMDASSRQIDDEKVYKLKHDLERSIIPGQTTLESIIADYTKPTKTVRSDRVSHVWACYFGDLVLVFNEVTLMSSWQANEMPEVYNGEKGVLSAGPNISNKKPAFQPQTKKSAQGDPEKKTENEIQQND